MRAPIISVVLLVLAGGCGPETSSPVPQPVPQFLRKSTPGQGGDSILLVGLPGAVAGAGQVLARPEGAGSSELTPSSAAGSFSVALVATINDRIEVRFQNPDGLSDPIFVAAGTYHLGPVLQGSRGAGVVSTPDPSGQVTVSNDGGPGQPPLIQATPGSDLLVSNPRSGEVISARTDASGLFTVQIAGIRGDAIHLLLVDTSDAEATSDFLSFVVP